MAIDLSNDPHRRYNILTDEWVLVSPHRNKRPWQGKVEKVQTNTRPTFDTQCYLCPGNIRANGSKTEVYEDVYVFDNDFGALLPITEEGRFENGLLKAESEKGICRVLCFSPNHSLTLPDMEISAIEKVVNLWQEQYLDLGSKEFINYVQIFENKGALMGCSNPHPHGQIWAQSSIPQEVIKKSKQQKAHWEKNKRSLLQDYLHQELKAKERLICENEHFVALVPFWAVWPYEAMIIPRRHIQNLGQLDEPEKKAYAAILKNLTQRFDLVFETSFPYSSGIHQAPTDGGAHEEWHMHMAFYPPLLRSASVKKFMVGYEMFANPQRDITAEMAAKSMRELR